MTEQENIIKRQGFVIEQLKAEVRRLEGETSRLHGAVIEAHRLLSVKMDINRRLEGELASEKAMHAYTHDSWLAMCTKWGEKDAECKMLEAKLTESQKASAMWFEQLKDKAGELAEAQKALTEANRLDLHVECEALRFKLNMRDEKAELWEELEKLKHLTPFSEVYALIMARAAKGKECE